MRCPEDVAEMAGFSSGGFGASSRHLSEEEAGIISGMKRKQAETI
jgi:hypothetical protein